MAAITTPQAAVIRAPSAAAIITRSAITTRHTIPTIRTITVRRTTKTTPGPIVAAAHRAADRRVETPSIGARAGTNAIANSIESQSCFILAVASGPLAFPGIALYLRAMPGLHL